MGSGSSEWDDESPEDILREIDVAGTGVCPHCGSVLVSFKDKDGSGLRCSKCEWNLFWTEGFSPFGKPVDVGLDVDLAKVRRKLDKAMVFLRKECPLVGDAYVVSKLLVLLFEERLGCGLSSEMLAKIRSILADVNASLSERV